MLKSTGKFKLLLVVFAILFFGEANAQDPEFSQFYANQLYLNPAFAGTHGCPRFNLNYRNQWPALSGTYVTYSASYDQFLKPISGGIGVLITHDQQGKGTINTTTASFIYSYRLNIGRKFSLHFGAQATWNQRFLDWNKLTFGDMIDARRGFIYETGDQRRGGSRGYFDVSVGVLGYSKIFYFGFVAKHLNMPNESMIKGKNSRMPIRMTAHFGAKIPLGKNSKYSNKTSISPNIMWSYQRGFMNLAIGMYVKYGVFTAGAWWREGDAFIVMMGVDTKIFKLGYSYDVTVSKLNNGVSGGSHEVSMGINLNCKKKPKTWRTISCPSF